jgi:DNA modification methylase
MTAETFLNGRVTLHAGDSRDVLKTLADSSIDSIVTDPPYALVSIVKRFGKAGSAAVKVPEDGSGAYARASAGFMGKQWDTGETAFAVEFWAECLRVLKPGGHVVAFSGTRTYHRMACAIEDAGFEVRDMLSWLYGSGFPKSHDVSKGIDKAAGAERVKRRLDVSEVGNFKGRQDTRPFIEAEKEAGYHEVDGDEPATQEAAQWDGWGTALKPACEPICFGRKPIRNTVAANVLEHGTGAINIDGCRISAPDGVPKFSHKGQDAVTCYGDGLHGSARTGVLDSTTGRWPANIIHDGSEEVIAAFPVVGDAHAPNNEGSIRVNKVFGSDTRPREFHPGFSDSGSAARFFYTAKADADDRLGSKHPTVKPVDLMQWLCRLVTPPGGTILDPFSGTGTTGEAAWREGFSAVLIEREAEYQADIRRRMSLCLAGPDERKRESIKAKLGDVPFEPGSLFALPDTPPSDRASIRDTRANSTSALRPNDRTNRNETLEPTEQP